MLSLALIGLIWEMVYSPNYGLINSVIGRTSNSNLIDWLGNSHLNLGAVLVEASWRQAGYVMVLYLAGLKAVEPSLREAAVIDGAGPWTTFRRIIFPVMRPINVVILVVTIIESLRAFDLVYITGAGNIIPGLELLSMQITTNIVGETERIGYGSMIAVVLLVISLVPICSFLYAIFKRERGLHERRCGLASVGAAGADSAQTHGVARSHRCLRVHDRDDSRMAGPDPPGDLRLDPSD